MQMILGRRFFGVVLWLVAVTSSVGVWGVGHGGTMCGRVGTPCFVSSLSALSRRVDVRSGAEKYTSPLQRGTGLLSVGSAMVLRKQKEALQMVFLPPDWDQKPVDDESDEGFPTDTPGRLKPSKRSKAPVKNPAHIDQAEEERTDMIRQYSPISGYGLSTDEVIEEMRPTGMDRHRLKLHPDEAFGSVFRYEGALVDTRPIHKEAWISVAHENNLKVPDDADITRAMALQTELAIQRVMGWTQDWGTTKRLAFAKAEAFYKCWQNYNHSISGTTLVWLENLHKAKIPMCIVTAMDLHSINSTISRMGLGHYFDAYVTAEDDVETRSQMYLQAAIKLKRPPNQVVYFDTDPEGVAAAIDVSGKSVSVLGLHPRWELMSSDLTVASLDELTIYNIRRLFSEVGEGRIEDMLQLEEEPQTKRSRWNNGPWGGSSYDDPEDPFVYSGSRR